MLVPVFPEWIHWNNMRRLEMSSQLLWLTMISVRLSLSEMIICKGKIVLRMRVIMCNFGKSKVMCCLLFSLRLRQYIPPKESRQRWLYCHKRMSTNVEIVYCKWVSRDETNRSHCWEILSLSNICPTATRHVYKLKQFFVSTLMSSGFKLLYCAKSSNSTALSGRLKIVANSLAIP